MSELRRAAKGGIWLAGFKFATQGLSWMVTIVVARLLTPEDYGLMSLASILTGYVELFSELGLGAALVQRQHVRREEYSSNFWFSVFVGCGFALVAFALAYPTGWIFNEPRVVPVTQTIAVLFVIGALMIVPFNILTRELRFKAIGLIQLIAVAVSSLSMLWMATNGFGVWTLVGGTIVLRGASVIGAFAATRWRPQLHFRWSEVRGFLRFGITVAGGRSLFYVFQKSDVFIVGATLGTNAVGLYSLAMQLASIPTDKLVSLVNQVSFPVLARFQNDPARVRELYERATEYLTIVVAPLFLGGAIWGDEIIRSVLGEQWTPIVFLFRAFCIAQLMVASTTLTSSVNIALGRSHWLLYFYAATLVFMPAAIYLASRYGLDALAIPWLVVYPPIAIGWMVITLKALGGTMTHHLRRSGWHALVALAVVASAKLIFLIAASLLDTQVSDLAVVVIESILAGCLYAAYLWTFHRGLVKEVWAIRKA